MLLGGGVVYKYLSPTNSKACGRYWKPFVFRNGAQTNTVSKTNRIRGLTSFLLFSLPFLLPLPPLRYTAERTACARSVKRKRTSACGRAPELFTRGGDGERRTSVADDACGPGPGPTGTGPTAAAARWFTSRLLSRSEVVRDGRLSGHDNAAADTTRDVRVRATTLRTRTASADT